MNSRRFNFRRAATLPRRALSGHVYLRACLYGGRRRRCHRWLFDRFRVARTITATARIGCPLSFRASPCMSRASPLAPLSGDRVPIWIKRGVAIRCPAQGQTFEVKDKKKQQCDYKFSFHDVPLVSARGATLPINSCKRLRPARVSAPRSMRMARRPRDERERKSPSACACFKTLKVYEWPGIGRSVLSGAVSCRKTPLSAPPL